MARGRLISSETPGDKKINDLSSDTCRLAFTWLIPFADCEGRTHGDPAMVRSMIFPRRTDITAEQMRGFIQEWADAKLVIWYEACGDWWIAFPNFDKHQNIRKDREAPSKIPPPPSVMVAFTPEQVRSNSGVMPDEIPVNLIKSNLKEEKEEEGAATPAAAATSKIFDSFSISRIICDASGMAAIPPAEYQRIEQVASMIDIYGEETVSQRLKTECDRWKNTKNNRGAFYRVTNMGWVDWAQDALVNNGRPAKDPKDMTGEEYLEWQKLQVHQMQSRK